MVIIAVGLGMFLNLILTEFTGLAAGGIVVPGYIAMNLHKPTHVILTILVALVTYLLVKLISKYMLLFGRRLLILCILIGYILGYSIQIYGPLNLKTFNLDLSVIGFVVPGLIAYWSFRQGVVETISAMIIASVIVRLLLILITGGILIP
ncbi:MAG: poly-gamma-glutamate biosynthesis protein PgsC [Candidatus Hydrothermia bacterium]